MPRKQNRLLREGKLAGLRRVYVSWIETNAAKREWINSFFERVSAETGALEKHFYPPLQTGYTLPGNLTKLEDSLSDARNGITDVVGVITNAYVLENMRKENVEGLRELARCLAWAAQPKQRDRLRVWLAAVDAATWKNYTVSDIKLADPEGLHSTWLIRLKEGKRFLWPSESPANSADEISTAVAIIIDKLI